MPKQLILFPFGGNAREALVSIQLAQGKNEVWDMIGFIDDAPSTWGKKTLGVKVLGGAAQLKKFPKAFVLAVPGNPRNFLKRPEMIGQLNLPASRFATVISPSASVSPDAKIGCNTLIMPNVVVSTGCQVGNHCVILPNTVISHEVSVGDYTCVGAGVIVSGGAQIENNCYIGSGTSIREKIRIGEKTLIGLGSNVVADIERNSVAFGNPAKMMAKVKQ